MRNFIQHFFNPVHVFCRLKDIGVSKEKALALTRRYEVFYKWAV